MPTYEYRCANGHDFEAFQKMSDDPVDRCPDCGARAERLLSAGAGLLFKGSGFYITDSRAADKKKKPSKEPGDAKTAAEPFGNADSTGKKAAADGSESPSGGATSPDKKTKVE